MEVSSPLPFTLTVSIVLHNSDPALLCRALASLFAAADVAKEASCVDHVVVMVVDNSTDPAYQQLISEELSGWPPSDFIQLSYTAQSGNRGFGAGHNSALASVDSDLHLILNPDAELQVDTLRIGLEYLQNHDSVVLLSPRVCNGEGEQEFLCKSYPSVLALVLRGFAPGFIQNWFRQRLDQYEMKSECSSEETVDVVLASGCFMLVRTAALRAIGGFNEDYFLYFEDFDLSLRLGGQGRLVFNPAMRIVHHGGYAASKGMLHVRYFITSGLTFFNHHGWRWI